MDLSDGSTQLLNSSSESYNGMCNSLVDHSSHEVEMLSANDDSHNRVVYYIDHQKGEVKAYLVDPYLDEFKVPSYINYSYFVQN